VAIAPGASGTTEPTAQPLPVKESTQYNEYNISIDVNPETRTVTGVQKVLYKNRTGMELEQLYFNLYLNAFRRTASYKPYEESNEPFIFPSGKDYGYINITSVMINNESAAFNVQETVLTIILPEKLPLEAELEISLVFDAYVPLINHRTGANDKAMWLGNFLPVLALYDDNGWHREPYYAVGSPFYANIANYTVQVTTPAGYMVTGTGEEVSNEANGVRTTKMTAKLARNFTFAVGRLYEVETQKTESGVYVNFYYYSEAFDAGLVLDTAARALEDCSARIGSYPYMTFDIVEVGMLRPQSGLSYAGVMFVDATSALAVSILQTRVGQSVAQQWFCNIIGNNPIKEAWLGEGVAQYVRQGIFSTSEEIMSHMEREYNSLQAALPAFENKSLLQDLSVYQTWHEYESIQHTRAKLMMYALEKRFGPQLMNEFLRVYYTKYQFRLVDRKEFIATAEEVFGMELDAFFRTWMEDFTLPPL